MPVEAAYQGVRRPRSDGLRPDSGTCRNLGAIPSFWIRVWSVVRLSPSSAAAPLGPPLIQPHDCNARRMASRWTSSSVDRSDEPGGWKGGFDLSSGGSLCSQLGSTGTVL